MRGERDIAALGFSGDRAYPYEGAEKLAMATFTNSLVLASTADEVFTVLRTTAQRARLLPPEAALELVEGPPLLELGSRTTWKLRRFGLSQTLVLDAE